MQIAFKTLALKNFKNHKSLTVNFGDVTNIKGRNGAGKSSIGDAITWVLFGTDTSGGKLDPRPIDSEEGTESTVELLVSIAGKDIMLGRVQKKTAKYFINGIPKKATEFNEFIEYQFDKNLFLSLFNPSHFFTQHWQNQRSQLLQYVSEPLNKEILAVISQGDRQRLEGPLKKHSLDDLDKLHREKVRTNDKAYERAAERVQALEEQASKNDRPTFDIEATQEEIKSLNEQKAAIQVENDIRLRAKTARSRMEGQIDNLTDQITRQTQGVQSIKDEKVQEICGTCHQPLTEVAILKVKENRQARFNREVATGKKLVQKVNELKKSLSDMPLAEEADHDEPNLIEAKLMELQVKVKQAEQASSLAEDIEVAKEKKEAIRKELVTSKGIVDAIKEFKTKRSELMVSKVDDLFTSISVKLYETLKNGEERATFEIEMDGKPYSKLSTAEKIKAGLELTEVLSKQSEVVAPTFVDNAESILNFSAPAGQLIVARVVDEDLTIQAIEAKGEE
ncbi:AAA family ATPase [Rossellomorea marisflavi]|uniref:AAA family ATPase n=1 Tax=Rossellomorea marisflavi TaxID=189381 RepID=UPI003D26C820